ncbi:MAG: HDOD domain-containing protein [Spirochaetes bacterium]|nr:HDOD domain-containing protein [Spirochaetota bacterium]
MKTEIYQELKFDYINHDNEIIINQELKKFLKNHSEEKYFDNLSYILLEIANNANKANLKRVHFNKMALNIDSDSDYKIGMNNFIQKLNQDTEKYFTLVKKTGFFVKIELVLKNDVFKILVTNNNKILSTEKDRVQQRIKLSTKFKTMDEIFSTGLDTQEGSGFGIILSLLIMKKIGLDKSFFKLNESEDATTFEISFPIDVLNTEKNNILTIALIKEIEYVPQNHRRVILLEEYLNQKEFTIDQIHDVIERDPSLTCDFLRILQSNASLISNKITSMKLLWENLDIKILKKFISAYKLNKIYINDSNLKLIEYIKDHSFEVAYYTQFLAKTWNMTELAEVAYLTGILHDFGKIIILSISKEIIKRIEKITGKKEFYSFLFQDLTDHYKHSIIGERLAAKWNFDHAIIDAIQYHHFPLEATGNKELVYLIYMADCIYYYLRNKLEYTDFESEILEYFKINSQEELDSICDQLKGYIKENYQIEIEA